jgi:hypothetical protein
VHPLWINDWLRLLGNARTQLFSSQIYANPLMQSPGASRTGLCQYFEKFLIFTDATSLGKIRDAYPLDLFKLLRAYHLSEAHAENDIFVYILVMALENRHLSMDTIFTIIETLLFFFCIQESLMDLTSLCEKPNGRTHHATFATRGKLPGFACTLAASLIPMRSGNSNFGLDLLDRIQLNITWGISDQ